MAPNGNKEKVIELLRQGLPDSVVATRLGLSRGTVSSYGSDARRRGLLHGRRRPGRPRSILNDLAPEVRRWLVAQIPNGGTLEEVVVAIVVDAYAEEMEG